LCKARGEWRVVGGEEVRAAATAAAAAAAAGAPAAVRRLRLLRRDQDDDDADTDVQAGSPNTHRPRRRAPSVAVGRMTPIPTYDCPCSGADSVASDADNVVGRIPPPPPPPPLLLPMGGGGGGGATATCDVCGRAMSAESRCRCAIWKSPYARFPV